MSPGPGSTSGVCSVLSPKRALPATEMTGLTVPSDSLARPPQPVRVSESVVPDSHSVCWSECENRLSGTVAELGAAARNCALVSGWNSGPRLNTGASFPSFQTLLKADKEGCMPYGTLPIGSRLALGIARPARTAAYWPWRAASLGTIMFMPSLPPYKKMHTSAL